MPSLHSGHELLCVNTRQRCVIETFLGEGGQGEVWQVRVSGHPYALKWFNDRMLQADPDLRNRIERLVATGAPSKRFLWPFELVVAPSDRQHFGYLRRLRAPSFVELTELLKDSGQLSFRTLSSICFLLCDELFALHAKGLCYADLNAGNFFVDPGSGEVEIFDNDNVDIDGKPGVMAGFPGFQAPEIVMRQAYSSRMTDLHSLAVMLFRIFHVGHPLLGEAEQRLLEHPDLAKLDARKRRAEVNRRLFGSEARFVFDPGDASNRPIPELHGPMIAYWGIYPQFFRDVFIRAFTTGLHNPEHGRVTLSEWRKTMARLRDAVMTCPACRYENFYDKGREGAQFACWNCHQPLAVAPLRLDLHSKNARAGAAPLHTLVLEPGMQLCSHHTDGGRYDFTRVTGEVTGPQLALCNRSEYGWVVSREGDTKDRRDVPPGGQLALVPGTRIRFGAAEGEVLG
jgi:eukaryotic-like serine/threonine-protein kinase